MQFFPCQMNTKTALFKRALFNVLIIIVDTDITFSDMDTHKLILNSSQYPLSTVESEYLSYNNIVPTRKLMSTISKFLLIW